MDRSFATENQFSMCRSMPGAWVRLGLAGARSVAYGTHRRLVIVEEKFHDSLHPSAPLRLNPGFRSLSRLFRGVERSKTNRHTRSGSNRSECEEGIPQGG